MEPAGIEPATSCFASRRAPPRRRSDEWPHLSTRRTCHWTNTSRTHTAHSTGPRMTRTCSRQRPLCSKRVGTFLYGRRLYELMAVWETNATLAEQSDQNAAFASAWAAACHQRRRCSRSSPFVSPVPHPAAPARPRTSVEPRFRVEHHGGARCRIPTGAALCAEAQGVPGRPSYLAVGQDECVPVPHSVLSPRKVVSSPKN